MIYVNRILEKKNQDPMYLINTVDRMFNIQRKQKKDIDLYNMINYAAKPIEFIQNGGDCEDVAYAKYVLLRDLGFKNLKLLLVYVKDLRQYHAITVVRHNDIDFVLDNLTVRLTQLKDRKDLKIIREITEENYLKNNFKDPKVPNNT